LVRLKAQGCSDSELARIRGPVGLAIGAKSPAEIAIAILAEMVQARRAPKDARIGGVVLAAGLSRRMGRNKLIVEVSGKSLVRHAVEAALEGGLDPVLVVTGHQPQEVEQALAGLSVRFVHNPAYADGLSTSLKRGIESLPGDRAGVMILLGDMPGVTPELVTRVKAAFDPTKGRSICIATAEGEHGHPVLWGLEFFPELMRLSGDHGARGLMAAHPNNIVEVVAGDAGPLTDIDTPEALEKYLAEIR
jgi:molybdenum cofactor cytidylyltransferase